MADVGAADTPLTRRFPRVRAVARAALGTFPTPVERADGLAPDLWLKRDDLSAESLGGNKVRPLEFLLAGVGPGDRVVTAGARGSTHALATAVHARRLGARVVLLHWPQEMNPVAERVRACSRAVADEVIDVGSVPAAYARGFARRLRGARWVPPGGSVPLGALGFVNAALELAEQIDAGLLPAPARIVLPLGSGGTTAGLLVGLGIAGLPTRVVAARVVPRIVGNRWHVLRLAWRTSRLLERLTGTRVPRPQLSRLQIVGDVYGGAYGRETPRGREAAARYHAWSGRAVDPTYSAKALAAALALPDAGPTLFWLTYDNRLCAADSRPSSDARHPAAAADG